MPGAAFIFDAVDRDAGVFGLEQFLERRFVIAQRGAGSQFGGQLLGGFGKDVEACKSSHGSSPPSRNNAPITASMVLTRRLSCAARPLLSSPGSAADTCPG